jgi:hypothetical protein
MSGDLLRIEVAGAKELKLTRLEYGQVDRQYYSIDDYPWRDGLRATIGERGKSSDGVRFRSTFVELLVPVQRYRSPRAHPQIRDRDFVIRSHGRLEP